MSGVHLALLCEDSQTDAFVRRFLRRRNFRGRDIMTQAQRLDEGAPPSLQEACAEYGKLQR